MADTMEESMNDLDPEGAIGEDVIDHAAHEKLINSIYALDGKKRNKNDVRGAGISSNNLDLLVHTKKESSKIKAVELKLKKESPKLVPKPLSALETEKAKRTIARDVMEKDTKKWEPIVHEIRVAPQIKYAERPKGVEMYKAMAPQKFSPRTPLEVELYEALGKSNDLITPDEPFTKAEKMALKAMSVKEAMERRKELLKHHELLSRMQVKFKRIKKIKSKRFRRGIRKEKEAEHKRQLEIMKETDPEAFLAKMEQVDQARMEERLTLKHKNGGKFARYYKTYSKYDGAAREAIQEMVRKGKELTQKRYIESSDEEEEDIPVILQIPNIATAGGADEEEGGKVSDLNSKNLEILKSINKRAGGWLDSSTKYVYATENSNTQENTSLSNVENMDDDQDDNLIGENENATEKATENQAEKEDDRLKEKEVEMQDSTPLKTLKKRKRNDSKSNADDSEDKTKAAPQEKASPKKKRGKSKNNEEEHDEGIAETSAKRQKITQQSESNNDQSNEKSPNKKKKAKTDSPGGKKAVSPKKSEKENEKKKESQKDTVEVVTLQPSGLEAVDDEKDEMERDEGDNDDGEVAVTMEELFEDEDVVEQFARDKAEEEDKKRPKVEDTKLPGWGSWSGPDYKQIEERKIKRRKRFQPKPKPAEKDEHPNLWLNPKRDEAIRQFQPKRVPFPYVQADQFSAANRQPVSRGFVRETAHKILIKPEVVTKLGHIIKPLNKDDFFKNKGSLEEDEYDGKEMKYSGHINFRVRDNRLKTKTERENSQRSESLVKKVNDMKNQKKRSKRKKSQEIKK